MLIPEGWIQQRRRPDDGVQHANEESNDDDKQDAVSSNNYHLLDVNKFDGFDAYINASDDYQMVTSAAKISQ